MFFKFLLVALIALMQFGLVPAPIPPYYEKLLNGDGKKQEYEDIEEPIVPQYYHNLHGKGKRDIEEPIVPQYYHNLHGKGKRDVEQPVVARNVTLFYGNGPNSPLYGRPGYEKEKIEDNRKVNKRVKRFRESRTRPGLNGQPWKNSYEG